MRKTIFLGRSLTPALANIMSVTWKISNDTGLIQFNTNMSIKGENTYPRAGVWLQTLQIACPLQEKNHIPGRSLTPNLTNVICLLQEKNHIPGQEFDPKPHKCDYCDYRSARSFDLENHMFSIHHKVNTYRPRRKCYRCGYETIKNTAFQLHMAKHIKAQEKLEDIVR